MKNKKIFLRTFILFCLFCSCHKDENVATINLGEAEIAEDTSLVSHVEIIPLENKEDIYVPDVNILYASSDKYVFSDSKNVIYIYDKKGNYISCSANNIGKGPDEYSIVTAFSYNPYSKLIEVVTPRHLLFYNDRFKLERKIELPTKASSNGKIFIFYGHIYDLTDHTHILIPTAISEGNTNVFFYDSLTGKITEKCDFSEALVANINMQTQCFTKTSNATISFAPPFVCKYLYSYDKKKNTFSKTYQIKIGKDGISEADIKQFGDDEDKTQSYLLNCKKDIPVCQLETAKYIISVVKNGNNLRNWHTSFYNKEKKMASKIPLFVNKSMSFPIIKSSDGKCLYCSIDGEALSPLLKHLETKGVSVSFTNIKKADWYILRYSLK